MHEAVRIDGEIRRLDNPVLVASFSGWSDSGGAASATMEYLIAEWNASPLAHLDSEAFYDFTVQRPRVRLEDGERVLDWPENKLYVARPPGASRDFVLLDGVEPHLRWRTFNLAIEELMRELGVETSITLGAQPAGVPHTRPLPVNLSASHPDFEDIFKLKAPASRYQGPTGIVGVMNLHHRNLGWRNASLWGLVPHYLTLGPNPNAMLSLVRTLDVGFGLQTSTTQLQARIEEFAGQVAQALRQSPEAAGYVTQLEEQYDEERPAAPLAAEEPASEELPATEDILNDLEKFFREQQGPNS
ncbi:MAG: PAC2 family protein [Dehalococcoidia bacterium]